MTSSKESLREPGMRRFLEQLAERGGDARCHWHRHLFPAEDAGLIRTQMVPVQTPRHRTRPIRDFCYRVTLTRAGRDFIEADVGVEEELPGKAA